MLSMSALETRNGLCVVRDVITDFDYYDAPGVHWTDDTTGITLLGVSGVSVAALYGAN
jgi:hypothetical protein